MRRLSIAIALLLSGTAPPVTVPSPSATATASPTPIALPSATASPSPRPDLTIVAVRRVLPTSTCVRSASWSGAGTKILYNADLQALRVRNADGSGDRELFRLGLPPGAFQQFVTDVTAFAPH